MLHPWGFSEETPQTCVSLASLASSPSSPWLGEAIPAPGMGNREKIRSKIPTACVVKRSMRQCLDPIKMLLAGADKDG